MKSKLIIIALVLVNLFSAQAQYIISTDNFNTLSNWTLNTAIGAPVNSVVPGANTVSVNGSATEDNRWIINNVYSNTSFQCNNMSVPAGSVPSQPVEIPSNNGNYLHLIAKCAIDAGKLNANWNASLSNKRKYFAAMNYDFTTTGLYSVNFSFWSYQAAGISVYYSTNAGTSWQYLQDAPGMELWVKTNITNTNFDNKATLRFGFLWSDASGTKDHPSIDAVQLSVPDLFCNFLADKTTICAAYQETVNFTNASLPDDAGITYNWTITPGVAGTDWQFTGGTNASSKNPKIQFLTANTFTVRLTITRSATSQSLFFERTIQSIAGCQCQGGGGTVQLINEASKSLTNWSTNWVLTNSANGNWQATPNGGNFNATADPGAYLRLSFGQTNGSYADMTWSSNLDFSNTNATYTLDFSISNQAYSSYQNQLRIFVSADGGASWPGAAFYTHNTNTGATWVAQSVNLSSFAGNPAIRIRIRGTRSLGGFAGAWDLGLKNVVLTKTSTGGSTGNEPTATVTLTGGTNPSCSNTSLTFTCNTSNLGSSTVTAYTWYVDGVQVQTGPSNTYTSATLTNSQVVTCAITTTDVSCPGPFTSLPFIVNRYDALTPLVWIQAQPGGSICKGTPVTFTAQNQNGGTSPTYQWTVNGSNVGSGTTYSSSLLEQGDVIQVTMNSNASCLTSNPVSGNYTISVFDTTLVTIQANVPLCEGATITFTANTSNGTTPYNYTWFVNGTNAGSGSTLTQSSLTSGTTINVSVSSASTCPGLSNTLVIQSMSIAPTSASVTPNNFCAGQNQNVVLSYTGGTLGVGATAKWYSDGTLTTLVGTGNNLTIPAPSVSTTYYLVFDGICNTTSPVSVLLNIFAIPNVSCPTNQTVSIGGSPLTLGGATPTGGTYSGNGVSGNIFTPTIAGLGPHIITYQYTDANSCSNSCTFTITVSDGTPPEVDFISDKQDICIGDTVLFTDLSTNDPNTWNWNFGGGSPTTSILQNPTVVFDTPGSYTISLTASNNDGSNTEVKTDYITVHPVPTVNVTSNSPVCEGNNLDLTCTGGSSWDWSGPDSFSSDLQNISFPALMTSAGTYSVTVTDDFGCTASAQVTVTVLQSANASITTTGPFCINDQATQFTGTPTGGTWSGTGITVNGLFQPSVAGTGTHLITYTISAGCGIPATQNITVHDLPQFTVSVTDETCIPAKDGTILVAAQLGCVIKWGSGNYGFSRMNVAPGMYLFTITDTSTTCKITGNASVSGGVEDCSPPHIYIPNIFSPNNDGENDEFYVRGYGISKFEIGIYNRWGNKVFESTNPDKGWDGTFRNKPCDPGVYAYFVKIALKNGRDINQEGTVTLVR